VSVGDISRWLLVLILLGTAILKLAQLFPPHAEVGSLGGPYGVVAAGEIFFALLLGFGSRPVQRGVIMLVIALVAGAGCVALWTACLGGEPVLCRCVGPRRLGVNSELMLQGLVLTVSGLALTVRSDPGAP